MKAGQSFLSALRLGVGFAGIFIAFDFFVQQIAPAVTAVVKTRGLDFPVLDVGWPPLAAITWASPIAPLTILLVLALIGALVQAASGSLLLGLAATALIAVYGILAADWNAPLVERECGLSGISIATLSVNGLLPYGVAANSLIDRIPGLRRISLSPRDTGSRFGVHDASGVFVEPMMIGVAVGAFFGILAGYEVKKILELAINVAAVMFILPHCGGLIGKGMEPVSLQLKGLIQKRFPKKMVLHFGIPIIIAYLLISTHFAPLYTTLAARAGAESVRSYAGEITAFTDGGNPVRFWFSYLFRGNVWAFAAIPPAFGLMYLCWRYYRRLTKEASK